MNYIDYAAALNRIDAKLHNLPTIAVIAILVVCIVSISGAMQFAVEESRAGRVNPVASLAGIAAIAFVGYNVNGVGLAVLATGAAVSFFLVAMSVRKTVWEIQVRLNHSKAMKQRMKHWLI